MRDEFEFINNIKSKYSLSHLGDDCAVLPQTTTTDLLLTADMLIEDIDFRLEWTTPELLGHKALAVSLSDIAAMGGQPSWALLSIGVPEGLWKTDFLDIFYAGWFALANQHGVELVGGDISRSTGKLVIDSIVGGNVAKGRAILRSTANPGDAIFVSGTLGAAAAGLQLLDGEMQSSPTSQHSLADLIQEQLRPTPELTLANLLYAQKIVTAMIDISDGFSTDLFHICKESRTGARVYSERLPLHKDLVAHFPADKCVEMALNGGEDFGLLFTVAQKNISLLDSLPVTHVGDMTENVGIIELMTEGKAKILEAKGFRHF